MAWSCSPGSPTRPLPSWPWACATPPIPVWAAQAILTGKRVYVPTEEVELYRYASTAPAAYYAMMKERLDLLLTSGVVVCSKHNLEGLLLGGAACEAAPAEAPRPRNPPPLPPCPRLVRRSWSM